MIASALYHPLYLLLVLVLTIFVMRQYNVVDAYPHEDESLNKKRWALVITIFLIYVIGFRPHRGFVDTGIYVRDYKVFSLGHAFKWDWDTDNFIFDNIFNLFGSLYFPIDYFFLLIAAVYFGGLFWACRKLFPNDTFLTLLFYLGALSTFSYGTNGIKSGAAASLFLLALAYREIWWKAGIFLILSLGFHHSMAAPIAVFVIACFTKDRQHVFIIWVVALFIAALHITFFQDIFAGLTDEQGAGYLQVTDKIRAVSGFRPDFILYSAIPIFLGDYIVRKYEIKSEEFDFLWNVYTLTNAIFLLCTYGSFINRIAYLSWLMYPFVLIYPFLYFQWHPDQNRFLRYVVYGHLGFTLFMEFIYYGI